MRQEEEEGSIYSLDTINKPFGKKMTSEPYSKCSRTPTYF
jgi:hypothetical protein